MVRSQSRQSYGTALSSDVFEQVVWASLSALHRRIWTLLRWTLQFPVISVPLVACAATAYQWGLPAGLESAAALVGLMLAWRLAAPTSFRLRVSRPVSIRWRSWSSYRRRWADTCALHGLTAQLNEAVLVPALRRLVIGDAVDVLTVTMLAGQSTTDWQRQAEGWRMRSGLSWCECAAGSRVGSRSKFSAPIRFFEWRCSPKRTGRRISQRSASD